LEQTSEPIPFGKYELLERLAVGGMAEVFRARVRGEGGFEKHLVIKRILPHLSSDSEFVVMLIDEAKIAVCLSHPNIVQVYDLGKIEGTYFIAMEFIEGGDLKEILRRCARRKIHVPIHHAIYITTEVLKGLDYAHSKRAGTKDSPVPLQIIHRDISPPNILLSYEGEVKIVDFGIAKASTRMMETAAGILKGKFEYMSPEQASGLAVDARTDLFSTALLLYEMLVGRNPFLAEADMQVLNNVRNARVVPPSQINPEIPKTLEKIIMKALELDVDKRYPRAGEMGADLLSFAYQSGHVSNATKLSRFMAELFAEEIAAGRTASSVAPGKVEDRGDRNTVASAGRSSRARGGPGERRRGGAWAASPPEDPGEDDDEGVTEAIDLKALVQKEQLGKRLERDKGGGRGPAPGAAAGGRRLPSSIPAADGKVTVSFFDSPDVSPDFDATFVPPPTEEDDSEAVTTIQVVPDMRRAGGRGGKDGAPNIARTSAGRSAAAGATRERSREQPVSRPGTGAVGAETVPSGGPGTGFEVRRTSGPETKTELDLGSPARDGRDDEEARPTTPIHAPSKQTEVISGRQEPEQPGRVDGQSSPPTESPVFPPPGYAPEGEPSPSSESPVFPTSGYGAEAGPSGSAAGGYSVRSVQPPSSGGAEAGVAEQPARPSPPETAAAPEVPKSVEPADLLSSTWRFLKERPVGSAFMAGLFTGFVLANLLGAPFCGTGEGVDLESSSTTSVSTRVSARVAPAADVRGDEARAPAGAPVWRRTSASNQHAPHGVLEVASSAGLPKPPIAQRSGSTPVFPED